jgi:protein SCO1/2
MLWGATGLIVLFIITLGTVQIGGLFEESRRIPLLGWLSGRYAGNSQPLPYEITIPENVPIGGPFQLTDDHGRSVSDGDYRGRWMLVFFGYTNCPDECPLTLQKMVTALKDLGSLADRIAPLFITVDPARDTPTRLASYLENLDTRISGLTGSDDQIAAVAQAYRVYYSPGQNEQSGADLVSHSTFLYLMNPAGKLTALFPQDVTADKLTATLRVRLSAPPQSVRSNQK